MRRATTTAIASSAAEIVGEQAPAAGQLRDRQDISGGSLVGTVTTTAVESRAAPCLKAHPIAPGGRLRPVTTDGPTGSSASRGCHSRQVTDVRSAPGRAAGTDSTSSVVDIVVRLRRAGDGRAQRARSPAGAGRSCRRTRR